MQSFRCKTCGTIYRTSGSVAPTTPRWSDGHECELELVRVYSEKDMDRAYDKGIADQIMKSEEEENVKRMGVVAQNGNTGEHYE